MAAARQKEMKVSITEDATISRTRSDREPQTRIVEKMIRYRVSRSEATFSAVRREPAAPNRSVTKLAAAAISASE